MLKSTLLSVLGLIIAHRTHVMSEKNKLFSDKFSSRRHCFLLLIQLLITFLLFQRPFALIFEIIVVFLTPLMMMRVTLVVREQRMKAHFVPLLDALILKMRAGRPFREAFVLQIAHEKPLLRVIMSDFNSVLLFQRPLDDINLQPETKNFFQELIKVDQQSYRSIEMLKALRRNLKIQENFRQKSRQALLQIKAQAWILASMYVLLSCFLFLSGNLQNFPALFMASFGLFGIGFVTLHLIGRNYRWKI